MLNLGFFLRFFENRAPEPQCIRYVIAATSYTKMAVNLTRDFQRVNHITAIGYVLRIPTTLYTANSATFLIDLVRSKTD